MATTTTVLSCSLAHGPSGQSGMGLCTYLVNVDVTGTYLSASKPSWDFAAAFAKKRQPFSAVNVTRVTLAHDYSESPTRYTAPNAQIALSSTGAHTNNVVTFRIDSGATSGATGSEIADATALGANGGTFSFYVDCVVTTNPAS